MIETGDLGEIKRVKVELKGESAYLPDSEYFREIAEKFLRYAGVEVVDEGYDAVLRVESEGGTGKVSFISGVIEFSAQFRSETFITAMTELILKIFGIQPLKKVLKRESRELRAGVAKALGEIGDARAVEALIEALKDEDSDVRENSIDALVKIAKKDLGVVDKLIKALRDKDSDVRGGITKVLGNLGWEPKSEEERVLYYIANGDWGECVKMGRVAVEFLIERLKDRNSYVRRSVAEALSKIIVAEVSVTVLKAIMEAFTQRLRQGLEDEDSYVRRKVARTLGEMEYDRVVEALIEALRDEDSYVRRSVAEALDGIGWKPRNDEERVLYYIAKEDWDECVKMGGVAVEFLIERLKDKDRYVRSSVAWALGKIGDARAVDTLIEALKDESSYVREDSIGALVKIAKKDLGVVDKLIKALRDEDSYVRGGIAKVLGNLGWEPKSEEERVLYYIANGDWDECVKMGAVAVEFLIERLKDRNSDVRRSVAEALGKIGDARAVDTLIEALKDEDSYVRASVAWALGEIGDARAVSALIEALRDEDSYVRGGIAKVLGNLGWEPKSEEERVLYYIANGDWDECVKMGAVAVEFLIERLKDRNSAVRIRVAEALGEIGDARAVDSLIESLKDRVIRRRVAEALGKIGDARAVEALIEALKDWDEDVRKNSIGALVKIAKKDLGVVDN
jgi:HEAT repeat protein